MAEKSGADPAVERNPEQSGQSAAPGSVISVTVKTPKDKEEIAISEDASVSQVLGGDSSAYLSLCVSVSVCVRLSAVRHESATLKPEMTVRAINSVFLDENHSIYITFKTQFLRSMFQTSSCAHSDPNLCTFPPQC